jgi:CTP:molybdopterin cytidylyltransferase MocA
LSGEGIVGILLAAGSASRFGSPKQLAAVEGVALVRRAALAIADTGVELLAVTGAYADEVGRALDGIPARLAYNAQWAEGMGGSIACGVRHLLRRAEPPAACLLCLVDQPLVGAPQLRQLLELHRAQPRQIVACDHGAALGPPCLFPAEFLGELAQLAGSKGARPVLERHRDRLTVLNLPEAGLDVDRPEDYRQLLARLSAPRD